MTEENLEVAQPEQNESEIAETVEGVETQESAPEETTEPENTSEKPKKSGFQKRIDELVREREESRQEARFWAEQARAKETNQHNAGESKAEPDQPKGPPKADDFDNYEQYIDALTDYKTDQKLQKFQESQAEGQRKQQDELAQRRQSQQLNDRFTEGREKYQDFDLVARNPSVPITQEMAHAIADSELGADMAYHLGSNPEEAAKIANMQPQAQLRALGRLEARLESKPVETEASKAPEPITPVTKGAKAAVDPNKLPIDEWMKQRWKQVHKANG
jgi:hypothetical protein